MGGYPKSGLVSLKSQTQCNKCYIFFEGIPKVSSQVEKWQDACCSLSSCLNQNCFRTFIQKLRTNWRPVKWHRFAIFGQENSFQQKDHTILVQKLPLWVSQRKAILVTSLWWTKWQNDNVKSQKELVRSLKVGTRATKLKKIADFFL